MLLALLMLPLTGEAAAESPSDTPSWTVQVDPLTTALGYVHVLVERRLAPNLTVYAGPHLRLFDGLITEGHEPYTGAGLELGARWFPNKSAPTGMWFQARQVVAYAWSTEPVKQAGFAGYTSGILGYTGIVGDWLVLAGGLGVQRLYYTLGDYGVEGWFPAAHTAVGVAF